MPVGAWGRVHHVQRPWGKSMLVMFHKHWGGHCSWSNKEERQQETDYIGPVSLLVNICFYSEWNRKLLNSFRQKKRHDLSLKLMYWKQMWRGWRKDSRKLGENKFRQEMYGRRSDQDGTIGGSEQGSHSRYIVGVVLTGLRVAATFVPWETRR